MVDRNAPMVKTRQLDLPLAVCFGVPRCGGVVRDRVRGSSRRTARSSGFQTLCSCKFTAPAKLKELIDEQLVRLALPLVTIPLMWKAFVTLRGDVPANTGVCSDVVVRAFSARLVSICKRKCTKTCRGYLREYPKRWGLSACLTHIDHRRVLNLATYFTRQQSASDYFRA